MENLMVEFPTCFFLIFWNHRKRRHLSILQESPKQTSKPNPLHLQFTKSSPSVKCPTACIQSPQPGRHFLLHHAVRFHRGRLAGFGAALLGRRRRRCRRRWALGLRGFLRLHRWRLRLGHRHGLGLGLGFWSSPDATVTRVTRVGTAAVLTSNS